MTFFLVLLKYLRLAPEIAFDRRGNYNKKSGGEVRRAADAGGPRVALRGAFLFVLLILNKNKYRFRSTCIVRFAGIMVWLADVSFGGSRFTILNTRFGNSVP